MGGKKHRSTTWCVGCAAAAAIAAACWWLVRVEATPVAPAIDAVRTLASAPEPAPVGVSPWSARAIDSAAFEDEPESRAAPESAPAPLVVSTGVRGRVRSPRVSIGVDDEGGPIFGVDPKRGGVVAEDVTAPTPHATIYGRKVRRGRLAEDGGFELGLDPGLWRVAVRQDQAGTETFEYWYAIVEVKDGEVLDLGEHRFSEALTRGRVVEPSGAGVKDVEGSFGDRDGYADNRGPLMLGGDAYFKTNERGEFAVAYSKYDGEFSAAPRGPALVGALLVPARGQVVRLLDILVGSYTEVVLQPPVAESPPVSVTIDVAVSESAVIYVWSDRTVKSFVGTPDGFGGMKTEERLAKGEYFVEVVDGFDWYSEKLTVTADAVVRIAPAYRTGRVVTGHANGSVSRVVGVGRFPLQRTDADGPFELRGLPPEGELHIDVAGRPVVVPADSGPRYEIK